MKKISQMVLGILLVVLSLTVTPKAAFAENKTVTVIEAGNEADFDKAISTVNDASEDEYIISLTDDVEIGGASIQPKRPVTVTILSDGHEHTLTVQSFIYVGKDAKVKLGSGAKDGSILNILGTKNGEEPGLLYISKEGTCEMYSGVSLSGRVGNNQFGGGVTVEGGTFHMHGGVIENCGIDGGSVCYGGGVAVVYGGKFIMEGGTITNCYVKSDYIDYFDPDKCFTAVGGGVFVSGGSSFVMNGGTISNNTATNMGGGIAVVASYEEISRGFGNLKSAVEIKGGTVENNSAKIGAGVFASAYYYIFANAICAPTPGIGQAANPGLYIDNAQICDNNATDGMGGGVFVAMLKSPAGVHIGKNTVIRENKAAVGGGVASYGYWTEMEIDKCTITGNVATNYGGGFAAQENTSGGQTTITNTVLCNNIAGKAASDVYLDRAPLKLPSAETMSNAFYLGEPDDVKKHKIDGWYIDKEDLRYTAQTKEQRTKYEDYASINGTGKTYLIAASKPSLAKITFTDEKGNVIYAESWHPHGTPAHQIPLPKAEKASDDTYDYIFEAWSPAIQHVTGHATYTAIFKRVFRKFNAKYQFNSVSDGERLPDEVKALLPADTTDYRHEQNIPAIAPSKTVVEVEGGQWVFKGFEKDTIPATMEHADATGNVTFVARWEFVKKDDPVKPEETVKPSETTTPIPEGNINLPQTGDNSDIALWSALLAVSAAAFIGMAFRGRQKKTR
mgnify:CR=1 FL=1